MYNDRGAGGDQVDGQFVVGLVDCRDEDVGGSRCSDEVISVHVLVSDFSTERARHPFGFVPVFDDVRVVSSAS